ncbi:MAG: hypothetical protein NZM25_11550 [Leptospiraceae bacterium]|nr:hypothetical protein [Leptospiraceae bacterium]MDW8307428.1 hypothetical protein [Leptospiraceae bacterium]
MENFELMRAIRLTRIIRRPTQRIFTFWDTEFEYNIISPLETGSRLRKGHLLCKKPVIITPYTPEEAFQGFSPHILELFRRDNPELWHTLRVLGYQVINTLHVQKDLDISSDELVEKIRRDIPEKDIKQAILRTPDDLWMFGVLRLTADIIRRSAPGNFLDFEERGFFKTPEEKQREEIEILFAEARENRAYLSELANTLQRYGLFEDYEDRFFDLVRHLSN